MTSKRLRVETTDGGVLRHQRAVRPPAPRTMLRSCTFLSYPRNATTAKKPEAIDEESAPHFGRALSAQRKHLTSCRAELERIDAELNQEETLDGPQIELLLLPVLKQVPLRG
jgi:hypothetical protein